MTKDEATFTHVASSFSIAKLEELYLLFALPSTRFGFSQGFIAL